MIKVDKDKMEINGMGLTLLSELTFAIDNIAEAFGMSHKDILTIIDHTLDEAIKAGVKTAEVYLEV